jgi:hypothetical protein
MTTDTAARASAAPSAWRAWCFLVWLSWQRQWRARQMVWIALGLLVVAVAFVAINTAAGRWSMTYWRWPPRGLTFSEWITVTEACAGLVVWPGSPGSGTVLGVLGECRMVVREAGLYVFSWWVVFSFFLSFLMPIWSLSFATEALGSEREGSSLVWLLTRPLPRSAIYLAKFVALLPWGLGLNLGGFAALCLTAGWPGRQAFVLYWPAVFWGTLTFCALFHLMGACFRRAAIVAIVYSFFLETIVGNMPGYMKRISISFYTRCMMFDAAVDYGIEPEKPSVYLPVDGATACWVLAGLTVVFVALGMVVFSRTEYQDLT